MKLLGSILIMTLMVSLLAIPFAIGGSGGTANLEVVDPDIIQPSAGYIPSDLNNDGKVDDDDLELMLVNFGECVLSKICYDLTGNNIVNSEDLTILLAARTEKNSRSPNNIGFPRPISHLIADPNLELKNTPSAPSFVPESFGVKRSITIQDVAEVTGIEEDVIKDDIMDISPDSSVSVSFPGKMIVFKATADDDSINLVRGYIGSKRTAQIVDGEIEPGEVIYRGRVVLEIEGQEQVESYLIVDGNEVDYIYGLVPIVNGVIVGDTPTSKLLFDPKKNEAMFSFGDGRGIVELKIISLERNAIRPHKQPPTSIIPNLGLSESQDIRPLPFWRRWLFAPSPQPEPDLQIPDAPSKGFPDSSEEDSGRTGIFRWFLGFFRSNSADDVRFKNIENQEKETIEIRTDDKRLRGDRKLDLMKDMEIEVNIDNEDGISLIEIKSNNFEKTFHIQTTDKTLILAEIAKIIDAPVEDIQSLVKFKN